MILDLYFLIFMHETIEFDDEFLFRAVEIYDERSDGNLTAELEILETTVTELSPE